MSFIHALILVVTLSITSQTNPLDCKLEDIPKVKAMATDCSSVTLGPPTGLRVEPVSHRRTNNQLYWDSYPYPDCISGINIYRDDYLLTAMAPTGRASGDYQCLVSNTEYTYKLSALDLNGVEFAVSDPVSRTMDDHSQGSHLGDYNVLVSLFKFPSFPQEPYDIPYARKIMFDDPLSAKAYFSEVSYGRLNVIGDIVGWFDMPKAATEYGCELSGVNNDLYYFCNNWSMIVGMLEVLEQQNIDTSQVDKFIFVINGLGTVGIASGKYLTFSATGGYRVYALIHEMGHGLGALHSGSIASGVNHPCPHGVMEDLDNAIGSECFVGRYTDSHDPMGGGYRHYSASNKSKMGFITPQQTIHVKFSGIYILTPLETLNGVKEIRIPTNALLPNTFYTLDYRTARGFNAISGEVPAFLGGSNYPPTTGVSIRIHRDRLVDLNRERYTDVEHMYVRHLQVGEQYHDPYRAMTISLNSADMDKAVLGIQLDNAEPCPCDQSLCSGTPCRN